jgi:hypothetical protein
MIIFSNGARDKGPYHEAEDAGYLLDIHDAKFVSGLAIVCSKSLAKAVV